MDAHNQEDYAKQDRARDWVFRSRYSALGFYLPLRKGALQTQPLLLRVLPRLA